MKRAKVLKAGSVKTRPLGIDAFTEIEAKSATMGKITKKQIKKRAKELGLAYDDEKIRFAKKIVEYFNKKAAKRDDGY